MPPHDDLAQILATSPGRSFLLHVAQDQQIRLEVPCRDPIMQCDGAVERIAERSSCHFIHCGTVTCGYWVIIGC
jgi:hypothetical protein